MPRSRGAEKKPCDMCPLSIAPGNMARHRRLVHHLGPAQQAEKKPCPECKRPFSEGYLYEHRRREHGWRRPDELARELDGSDNGDSVETSGTVVDSVAGGGGVAGAEDARWKEAAMDEHRQACAAALEEVRRRVDAHVEELEARGGPATRGHVDLPRFKRILDQCDVGTPLPYERYMEMWMEHEGRLSLASGQHYVVCTPAEAGDIVRAGTPLAYLFEPAAWIASDRALISLEGYMERLRTKAKIDVHYWNRSVDEEVPVSVAAHAACRQFMKDDGVPMNLLNLADARENAVPQEIADIQSCAVLREVKPGRSAGKAVVGEGELSSCRAFTICGKRDSFSLPHWDRHGTLTTVMCECGQKLWIAWPSLTAEQVAEWLASEGERPPPARPMALLLRPGDRAYQPPGRVHAPYTVDSSVCTGTMHLDSRAACQSMKLSLTELRSGWATNENPADDYAGIMTELGRLWRLKSPVFEWDDDARLSEFLADLSQFRAEKKQWGGRERPVR